MGSRSKAPPPDPRMGEAALRQIQLAEQQYQDYMGPGGDRDWMRSISNEALGISRSTAERSNAMSDYQLGQMRFNDDRYKTVGIPFEDRLLEDVNRFDSDAYKDSQVDMARGEVQSGFDSALQQQRRGLNRMGINPSSGKALAMQTMADTARASAVASAANKTRLAADQIGLSSKMSMYGGMKGLAGLGNANAQLATGAMGLGLNAGGAMTGAGGASLSANNAAFGSAMGGMSAGISGLGSYNQLQQSAKKINNDNDPFASILGAGTQLGVAAMPYMMGSDRRLKEEIVLVGRDERTGLNLYEFKYIGGTGKRFVGVMADEVIDAGYSDAVMQMPDGYLAVNYHALGLEMIEVDELQGSTL